MTQIPPPMFAPVRRCDRAGCDRIVESPRRRFHSDQCVIKHHNDLHTADGRGAEYKRRQRKALTVLGHDAEAA